jgi:hypothetical protein
VGEVGAPLFLVRKRPGLGSGRAFSFAGPNRGTQTGSGIVHDLCRALCMNAGETTDVVGLASSPLDDAPAKSLDAPYAHRHSFPTLARGLTPEVAMR